MTEKLTISICTRDRANIFSDTLGCLLETIADSPHLSRVDILVVDQSVDDQSREIFLSWKVQYPKINMSYVSDPNRGLSYARNISLKHCRGDVLVCLDDDVLIAAKWLSGLFTSLKKYPSAAILGGKVLYHTPPRELLKQPWFKSLQLSKENWLPILDRGKKSFILKQDFVLITANAAIRKKHFSQIGQFDTDFAKDYGLFKVYGFEDFDYIYRALKLGLQIVYCPEFIAYHRILPFKTTRSFFRKRLYNTGLYYILFCKKHFSFEFIAGELWPLIKMLPLNLRRMLSQYMFNRPGNFYHELQIYRLMGSLLGLFYLLVKNSWPKEKSSS